MINKIKEKLQTLCESYADGNNYHTYNGCHEYDTIFITDNHEFGNRIRIYRDGAIKSAKLVALKNCLDFGGCSADFKEYTIGFCDSIDDISEEHILSTQYSSLDDLEITL